MAPSSVMFASILTLFVLITLSPLVSGATRDIRDPYRVLGVKEGDDPQTIRKAFNTLVKKYHPDKSKDPHAAEKFIEIMGAYDMLRDPKASEAPSNDRENDDWEYEELKKTWNELLRQWKQTWNDYDSQKRDSNLPFKSMKRAISLAKHYSSDNNSVKRWNAEFYSLEIPPLGGRPLVVSVKAHNNDWVKVCVLSKMQKDKGDVAGECRGSSHKLQLVFMPKSINFQVYSTLSWWFTEKEFENSSSVLDNSKVYFIAVMGDNYHDPSSYSIKVTQVDGTTLEKRNTELSQQQEALARMELKVAQRQESQISKARQQRGEEAVRKKQEKVQELIEELFN